MHDEMLNKLILCIRPSNQHHTSLWLRHRPLRSGAEMRRRGVKFCVLNTQFNAHNALTEQYKTNYLACTLTAWEPSVTVAASVVCLSRVRSRKLS